MNLNDREETEIKSGSVLIQRIGSVVFITNSYLKSLRHPISEADGELLHLGNLQPLLLCLVLRASFHHHLEDREANKAIIYWGDAEEKHTSQQQTTMLEMQKTRCRCTSMIKHTHALLYCTMSSEKISACLLRYLTAI